MHKRWFLQDAHMLAHNFNQGKYQGLHLRVPLVATPALERSWCAPWELSKNKWYSIFIELKIQICLVLNNRIPNGTWLCLLLNGFVFFLAQDKYFSFSLSEPQHTMRIYFQLKSHFKRQPVAWLCWPCLPTLFKSWCFFFFFHPLKVAS